MNQRGWTDGGHIRPVCSGRLDAANGTTRRVQSTQAGRLDAPITRTALPVLRTCSGCDGQMCSGGNRVGRSGAAHAMLTLPVRQGGGWDW